MVIAARDTITASDYRLIHLVGAQGVRGLVTGRAYSATFRKPRLAADRN